MKEQFNKLFYAKEVLERLTDYIEKMDRHYKEASYVDEVAYIEYIKFTNDIKEYAIKRGIIE